MKLNILHVDDNPDDHIILSTYLSQAEILKFDVTSVNTGKEGLQRLAERKFDIIFLDFMMPGMTGLEFISESRKRKYKTPIVLTTNSGSESIAVETLRMGARDYITKEDMDLDRLLEAIYVSLTRQHHIDWVNGLPAEFNESVEDLDDQIKYEQRIKELVYEMLGVKMGQSYQSLSHDACFSVYMNLVARGLSGICIVREDPVKILDKYGLKPEEIMIIASKPLRGYEALVNLQEVSRAISRTLARARSGGAVVLLDGLEYLITRFDFEPVYNFIQEKRFDFLEADAVFLIPADTVMFSERECALLSFELETLDEINCVAGGS